MEKSFDILIIGSGPGGYVTAIRAAQLGLRTAIVEDKNLGGICLNWGCIPTKAMLRSSEIYHYLLNASEYGLSADNINYNLKAITDRSASVSKKLNKGVKYLLDKNCVKIFSGFARFSGKKNEVDILNANHDQKTVSAKNIIIAAGAKPKNIEGIEADNKLIWTYFEALRPKKIPKTLMIIGGGAIGIEFASFYNSLGSNVTVIEMQDRILPNEDEEISTIAAKEFLSQGIEIITSGTIKNIVKGKQSVTCKIITKTQKAREILVERIISAVGITGNVENLGLENTQIKTMNGHILTDEFNRTNEKNVYAIGDITGPPWLAHKAEHEGVICVEKISGLNPNPLKKEYIPNCTYCRPQIASVGLTEALAIKKGLKIKVGRFPFIGNGKAIAMGETNGMIKTIFDAENGQLIGSHMIGAEVTELIHSFVVAMGLESTEEDLMRTIFAHPTLSEGLYESVLEAYNKSIHI